MANGKFSNLPPAADIAAMRRAGATSNDLERDLRTRWATIRDKMRQAGYDPATGLPVHRLGRPTIRRSDTGPGHHVGGGDHCGGLPVGDGMYWRPA